MTQKHNLVLFLLQATAFAWSSKQGLRLVYVLFQKLGMRGKLGI